MTRSALNMTAKKRKKNDVYLWPIKRVTLAKMKKLFPQKRQRK